MTAPAPRRRSGRQLSDQATEDIRTAALKLARELGPENVTMERVASETGVSKTTIYRRWPNSSAVIMDAFLSDIEPLIRYRPATNLSETMAQALKDFARSLTPERRALLRHLIGAAQSSEDIATAFWENWIFPRRREGLSVITAAGKSAEEGEVILDLLFGAVYYRLLIPYAEIDDAWIDLVVKSVLERGDESR